MSYCIKIYEAKMFIYRPDLWNWVLHREQLLLSPKLLKHLHTFEYHHFPHKSQSLIFKPQTSHLSSLIKWQLFHPNTTIRFWLTVLQVLCHLPLHKAIPMHISAILQSVNKLRFYRTSGVIYIFLAQCPSSLTLICLQYSPLSLGVYWYSPKILPV